MDIHFREFLIGQTNKMVVFQTILEKSLRSNRFKEKVFKMARSFAKRGRTKQNVQTYQKLGKQMRELTKGAASKLGRRSLDICVTLR